ncbi:hypothetical protein K435DRAFT_864456 [Dendrothele bispora CBS 962.96]|uniref:Uncharacterized protein n=1 Tax=Dendrothele bispora (strain CBS 962.96) TaxID=1314807 RepID=A0A4S8LLW3_DENBC|nr:hypothetical protein K435DRAFT_864456 [Dendrothele bispora CBS 962.96]
MHTPIVISPSLIHLRLQGTCYSNPTLELTCPSIITPRDEDDENGNTSLSQLFVTACKLEWIEDNEMFFGWMPAIRPHLNLVRLDSSPLCAQASTQAPITKLEELWFDMVSTRGPPAGIIHLNRLHSLRRLGLTAVLSGLQDNITQKLVSGLAQFFEIFNTNITEITHLAIAFSFSTTSLVFNPFRVPW